MSKKNKKLKYFKKSIDKSINLWYNNNTMKRVMK